MTPLLVLAVSVHTGCIGAELMPTLPRPGDVCMGVSSVPPALYVRPICRESRAPRE